MSHGDGECEETYLRAAEAWVNGVYGERGVFRKTFCQSTSEEYIKGLHGIIPVSTRSGGI